MMLELLLPCVVQKGKKLFETEVAATKSSEHVLKKHYFVFIFIVCVFKILVVPSLLHFLLAADKHIFMSWCLLLPCYRYGRTYSHCICVYICQTYICIFEFESMYLITSNNGMTSLVDCVTL